MYYSHPCTYCGRLFYTYNNNKGQAAEILFRGIKKHLTDYNEDHKEYEMDDQPSVEADQMYAAMKESTDEPQGAYELQ